ncbi:nuclear export factor CRM1 [Mucor lusitanicus]|uniref:Exportin-1 n=1 Tax=Mucor circinelloides f. lusitanicus TaxID=29924 RepID=A0A8H4F132_MUCCL|nr:nuclear export factor CRM1 [Mucor lusitanicus]
MSIPFNVKEFDSVVQTFYEGKNSTERQKAQTTLTEFQSNASSWQLVDQILEQSSCLQSKFIALGVLEDFIKVRWNTIPMEQRFVMRNYIVKSIIQLSSNETTLRSAVLNKFDLVLIQIVKKDWPQYWPSFIQEIVDSSVSSVNLCENNMKILRYLSEEVFDFSVDHMTVAKMHKLKEQMVNEFGSIFDLCKTILGQNNTNAHLIRATLETLQKFICWIPVQFVYQQDLVQLLQANIKGDQRNLVLQCFAEIISLDHVDSQQYSDIIFSIYTTVCTEITNMVSKESDIAQLYMESDSYDQEFIQVLATFLTTMLSKYRLLIEGLDGGGTSVHDMLCLLLKVSQVPEREVWKICLDYWGKLAYDVLQDTNHGQTTPYQDVLKQLCSIMIQNMVKPDDVFVIENDEGEISREFIKQSDTTALYKSMRHVFGLLTTLDPAYVQSLIREQLKQLQLDGTHATWSWDQLFRICWAVGMMSGAISEQQESQFLQTVLTGDLYQLLQKEETANNLDQQWVVASCMLYIATQYPHFLKSTWTFTSWLLQRVFSYMQCQQDGLKEMACDSFLKICQGCKDEMVVSHQLAANGEYAGSVLETVLTDLKGLTSQLNSQQICMLYEAVGTMISATLDVQLQERYIHSLMEIPNEMIKQSTANISMASSIKTIINMVRVNTMACRPIGPIFRVQLQHLTPTLVECYTAISQHIQTQGPQEQLYLRARQLIIELLETFILSNDKLDVQDQTMLTSLLTVILMDYKNAAKPETREPNVLGLLTCLFEKMQDPIWPDLLKETIDIVFVVTLPMITANFVDYPECRHEFYRLLKVLNKRCFIDLFQSAQLFQINMDSIMWGTKHTMRDISQIALQTCLHMISEVSQMEDEDVSSQFFETYYVRILTDILEVLVDPDCRNGFNYQSQILARMLELVQEGEIYTRLFNPDQVSNPLMSNVEFLQQYVLDLLCNAFPLLHRDQIEVLVMGMFEYSGDLQRFQNDIRDFLIDIREVNDESESQQKAQDELNAELELLRGL